MNTRSAPYPTKCYCALTGGAPLVPYEITRRAPEENDVAIDIEYVGICHSDIHFARDEFKDLFGPGTFPMVPGHEIVGRVVTIGQNVTKFKIGDKVGVGCMVDSCRQCTNCKLGEEQFCVAGYTITFGGKNNFKHTKDYDKITYGGFSQSIVVDEEFVLRIPDHLNFAATAPLLCAGITTYSPLVHHNLRPHHRFAVAGLGGVGHMAIKFGKAFGAHTTVLSRGTAKKESALNDLKADSYIDITNPEDVKSIAGSFDFILDTISAPHDLNMYLGLLKLDGKMVCLGVPTTQLGVYMHNLVMGRKILTGSLFGGIKETQEMLDFCGRNNITSDIEIIQANQINEAFDRTMKSDVKYRFVIDVRSF